MVLLDAAVELYHQIAFPIYGIEKVKRSEYIRVIDRAKLPYLRWYEKVSCAYCGYANGWLRYAAEIAARTESHFCAIAHLEERGYKVPSHEKAFMKYGDKSALLDRDRQEMAREGNATEQLTS